MRTNSGGYKSIVLYMRRLDFRGRFLYSFIRKAFAFHIPFIDLHISPPR